MSVLHCDTSIYKFALGEKFKAMYSLIEQLNLQPVTYVYRSERIGWSARPGPTNP